METHKIPWHLIPGNSDIQIENIMEPVRLALSIETRKIKASSQGFNNDEQAARKFVMTITEELRKLGFEGLHDLHQSKSNSGYWYYNLLAIWPIGQPPETVFSTFKEASSVARVRKGKVKREGDIWRVFF